MAIKPSVRPNLTQFGTRAPYKDSSGKREVRGNRLSDSYALLKDVVNQSVLSFRISWAVWVKLDNYGFRGNPTGESQTSLPKE
jgi:hypothetical protein